MSQAKELHESDGWRQENRTLEVLASLSYRTGELSPYLQELARGVNQLLSLDWTVVTLCRDGAERVLASTIDLGDERDKIYSLHGTLTGTVVATGCPLVVEDATATTEYGKAPEGYRAYLGVPLRLPTGEVIGTICSFQQHSRHFRAEEVRLAAIFAERAATAIDNYQLYQHQCRFNETLEAEVAKRTEELRATQAKLLELNSQLELRVEQRTAQLQQTNEQLRQLAENMHQIFWMYSRDGEPIYISSAFEKIWGLPCDRWYENPEIWQSAIHPEDRERVCTAFEQDTDGTFNEEYRIIRPDSTVRIIRDQAFPIRDESGQLYRIAGIAEDITERQQAEREMLKVLERLAEIGELAATIVHEVRNPLTTVLLGLSSFKRLDLPERYRMRLSLALDEADRLNRLLNEILLYAKPQSLQRSELELNAFITQMLDELRSMPAAAGRYIEFIPAPIPAKVLADPDKLKQVFINLVANACEAVDSEDAITWRVKQDAASDRVCIQFQNGGAPIPPEVLPQLTKPFFTTKACGNGLGLAIVKRIVEAHGGELFVESAASVGTTVTVYLPLATLPGQSKH